MAKRTTTIFAAFLALHDLLEAQTWPPHPTTGEAPLVHFGDTKDVLQEGIFIMGAPAVDTERTWATLGAPSVDEKFTLRVRIGARVIGQSRREAVARIDELHAVVETALRDQTTGKPTTYFVTAVGGVQYLTVAIASTAPAFGPLPDGGDGAGADIDFAFKARI